MPQDAFLGKTDPLLACPGKESRGNKARHAPAARKFGCENNEQSPHAEPPVATQDAAFCPWGASGAALRRARIYVVVAFTRLLLAANRRAAVIRAT